MKKVLRKILSIALATSVVMACFTATAFAATTPVGVSYSAHVQDIGWQAAVTDGVTAGTSGQSKRVEALKVSLTNAVAGAHINYQVHVQDHGWMPVASDGALAGTTGEAKRIEAIAMTISGLAGYSIEYRVHVQDIGWMSWVKNGAITGTVGQSKRIEAIQIRVVAPTALEVLSAKAINGNQVLVTFNKEVDKTSAENEANYQIGNYAIYADSAILQADKKSVIINTWDQEIKGTNLYIISPIYAANSTTEKSAIFTSVETFTDTKSPTVLKVDYPTFDTATVTFSEPIWWDNNVNLTATVGGSTVSTTSPSYTWNDDYTVATFPLAAYDANKAVTVTWVGAQDVAGNLVSPNPTVLTFLKNKTDTTLPTVVSAKAIGDNKAEVTFSEKLNSTLPTITVNGASTVTTTDNITYTATFAATSGIKAINVSGYTDLSGNAGLAYSKLDTFTTDGTKPTIVSTEVKTFTIASVPTQFAVVHFSEAVTPQAAAVALHGTRVADYISYDVTTGAIAPLSYLKANGADVDDAKSIMINISSLANGSYTLTLPDAYVEDTSSSTNDFAAASISFVKGDVSVTDTTAPTVLGNSDPDLGNTVMYVGFSEDMNPATALNVANYKVNGVSIFSAAIFDGSASTVKLTIKPGTIVYEGYYNFTVDGVKDKALNTMTAYSSNSTYFYENVKPTIASAALTSGSTIAVTFSEVLGATPAVANNNIEVYVNGVKVALTSTTMDASNKVATVTLTSAVPSLSDTVQVKLVNAALVDLSGNTAVTGSLVTCTH